MKILTLIVLGVALFTSAALANVLILRNPEFTPACSNSMNFSQACNSQYVGAIF